MDKKQRWLVISRVDDRCDPASMVTEDAEVAARRIQIRLKGRKGED